VEPVIGRPIQPDNREEEFEGYRDEVKDAHTFRLSWDDTVVLW